MGFYRLSFLNWSSSTIRQSLPWTLSLSTENWETLFVRTEATKALSTSTTSTFAVNNSSTPFINNPIFTLFSLLLPMQGKKLLILSLPSLVYVNSQWALAFLRLLLHAKVITRVSISYPWHPPELLLTATCCAVLSADIKEVKGPQKNGSLMIQSCYRRHHSLTWWSVTNSDHNTSLRGLSSVPHPQLLRHPYNQAKLCYACPRTSSAKQKLHWHSPICDDPTGSPSAFPK